MEIGTKSGRKFRIGAAIFSALVFTGFLFLFDYLFENRFESIYSYIIQGVLFGIIIGIGIPYISRKFSASIDKKVKPMLAKDEQIEIEGPANLMRKMEGVGGKIFLTDKRMIFKSHKYNIQNTQTEIPYGSIEDVSTRKTAGLVSNGLRISTKDGEEYNFVVYNRDMWVDKIRERVK